MLKVTLLWLWVKMSSYDDRAKWLRKTILVSFLVLSIACFVSNILVDSYFIDNRPRESRPAEYRTYPRRLKVSYGATVYLTENEARLSDVLLPASLVIFVFGAVLNTRWKILAPYHNSKSEAPIAKKRKSSN